MSRSQVKQRSFFSNQEDNCFRWRPLTKPISRCDTIDQFEVYILKEDVLIQHHVSVVNQLLIKHKKGIAKWIDLENALIDHFYQSPYGQGITFMKNNQELTIYGDVIVLFSQLKQFTVQFNFQKHYTLVKKLGKGNFADVYKAQSMNDYQNYAVKCIFKSVENLGNEKQIKKEIAILRQMNQQSIVRFHEAFENEECIFLVFDLLDGGDLHKAIKQSPGFSEEKTQKIIRQLLEGIAYLHDKGIMHRDLKPHNILLRNKYCYDNICIADFGLAEYYNKQAQYDFVRCGTPGYVAPEVLMDRVYDFKVDVYSVGIIMYQLLCGHSPFEAFDYDQTITKNHSGLIDYSLIKISLSGMDLLKGLLEYNPNLRLTAQKALEHYWFVQSKLSKACQFKVKQFASKPRLGGSPSPPKKSTPQAKPLESPPMLNQLSPLSCRNHKVLRPDPNSVSPKTISLKQGAIIFRKSAFNKIDQK